MRWTWLAVGLQVASRLAYVLGVGTMLLGQTRQRWFTARHGSEEGYRRFRRIAAGLMNLDAVTFALACILTRGTLDLPVSPGIRIAIGVVAILIGASTKLWARRTLGSAGYHWRDFFVPPGPGSHRPVGPYRYLKNPMYTVGYLHAYGIALVFDSAVGLALAAFAQLAVLIFYRVVERPHFIELSTAKSPTDEADEADSASLTTTKRFLDR